MFRNSIVGLPIGLKGDSKYISGNSLNPLGTQNKDIGTAYGRTIRKLMGGGVAGEVQKNIRAREN